MKTSLLGSSSSEDGILKMIADYFCVGIDRIHIDDGKVIKDGKIFQHLRIVKKQNRFRFELIDF